MAIDLQNFIEGIGTLTSKPVESPLFDEFIGEPQTQSKQYSYSTNTLPDETQYKTTSTSSYGYSLSDLERDPEFSAAAKRFLDGIGSNENIFEFLRDEKYSLSSAIARSFQTGTWTDQQKQDYVYLRDRFDNTDLRGFKERFNLVKDVGIDILADPLNIVAGLFAIPTGGASIAGRGALQAAVKGGIQKMNTAKLKGQLELPFPKQLTARQIAKRKKLQQAKALRGAKYGALYGAAHGMAWAGPHEYFLQDIDINLGARDELDLTAIGGYTLAGGVFGGGLGGILGGVTGLYGNRYLTKEFKHTNENLIDNVGSQPRKEVVEQSKIDRALATGKNALNIAIANTVGKPVTWFNSYVEKSPALQDFLLKLRYDYDTTLLSRGKEGVKQKSFGLFMGETIGMFQFGLSRSLNSLYRVGWRARLDPNQNSQLNKLLRNPDVTVNNVDNLAGQFDDDVILAYKGVRETLDLAFKQANDVGLFGPKVSLEAGYFPRLFKYDVLEREQDKFKQILIDSGHADPLNDARKFNFLIEGDEGLTKTELGILKDAKGIDADTFGIDFLKEAGVKTTGGRRFARIEDATEEQIKKAKELKADKIVEDMLEYRWTPFELRSARQNNAGTGFLNERRFRNIKDEDIAEFLEGDVQLVLEDYFTNMGQAIARTKYFGRTISDFEENTVQPIVKELLESGMNRTEANKIAERVRFTYRRVTGIESYAQSPLKRIGWAREAADWGKLLQQMAHLPFATLSSVTEPLLLLQRAGLKDSPKVLGDIASAIVKEGNAVLDRTIRGYKRGVLGQRVKGPKDISVQKGESVFEVMPDDVWGELYKTGLALEQAVQERIEGLAGEGLYNSYAKNIQAGFFKVNLLSQWTKAVQLASFTTGKRLIKQNAEKLAQGNLSASNRKYLTQQLNDLGIDENKAVNWYKSSLIDGKFNNRLAKSQEFYADDLTSGANRFVKEIILNPSTAEANRPLWFSTPAAQMLIQFAGYPTVFNNTILKRFSNEAVSSPMQSIPKVLPTVLLMSAVAHIGNTVRSNGANLRDYETGLSKDEGQLIAEAVRRWGGFGPFDYVSRYTNESQRNVGGVTSTLKAFAGPLPQDAIDAVLYRKGLAEVGVTNLPGYAAYDLLFGEGTKKALRSAARGSSPKPTGGIIGSYAKGGIVKDVPNVKDEPDERIDKLTGVPYDVQAGVILEDEEER